MRPVRAHGVGPDALEVFPTGPVDADSVSTSSSDLYPLSVPAYHSDPGAPASLYLNFTGSTISSWGGYNPGTTPAYDTDGDPTTFSDTELSNINQIWQRVAEKYSPFNIDITTAPPANMSPGHTQQIVIGGNGSWFGLAGGVSYVGSFTGGTNTSFVFSDNLAQSKHGVPAYVAEAAAHEAGHSFGLVHQSDWVNGTKTNEYSFGTYVYQPGVPGTQQSFQPGSKSPIMGESYFAERGLWWNGTSSNGADQVQDDMSIISSASNGFGYRPEPANTSFAAAAPLTIDGDGSYHAQGVIIHPTDRNYFSFDSAGGLVSFAVNVAPFGPMLDASVDLYDSHGNLIAESATSSLSEGISANVAPGTYDLVVFSAGNYGDVGQYSISGALGALVPEPAFIGAIAFSLLLISRRPSKSNGAINS